MTAGEDPRPTVEIRHPPTRWADLPEWEVVVRVPGRRETKRLAARLEREGVDIDVWWTRVYVPAADETEARELTERLRLDAPSGTSVRARRLPRWRKLLTRPNYAGGGAGEGGLGGGGGDGGGA